MKFIAYFQNGKFQFTNPDKLNSFLGRNPGILYINIEKESKNNNNRTDKENRYYWGVVIDMISQYTGHTDDEVHEGLKYLFLCDRSQKLPKILSTKHLSIYEFENYLSKVRQFASADLGIYIPMPNEPPPQFLLI